MFNRTLIKRGSQVKSFKPGGTDPATTGLLAVSLHRPTPCKQLSQCTPHKSLLNCHLVAALPAGCPTRTHVLPEASEVCRGADRVLPQEWIKTGDAASHASQTRKENSRLPILENKNHYQMSKMPRGQKEVLCCPLSDRIESPNHKYPKKNKGRKGERKRNG